MMKGQHARQGVPACAIAAQLSWVRPTAFQLDFRPTKGSSHLVLQTSLAEEVMGPSGKTVSMVFLDGCVVSVQLSSKHVYFLLIDHCSHQPQLITTGEVPETSNCYYGVVA